MCWPLPPPFTHLHQSGYLFLILCVNSGPICLPRPPASRHQPTHTRTRTSISVIFGPWLFMARLWLQVFGGDQLTWACRWPYDPMYRCYSLSLPTTACIDIGALVDENPCDQLHRTGQCLRIRTVLIRASPTYRNGGQILRGGVDEAIRSDLNHTSLLVELGYGRLPSTVVQYLSCIAHGVLVASS